MNADAQSSKVLYFGCWPPEFGPKLVGHHLYRPGREHAHLYELPKVLQELLDGGFCYPFVVIDKKCERKWKLTHIHGWTVLAAWDTTADARPGSHSTFLAFGQFDFGGMMAIVSRHFTPIWSRLGAGEKWEQVR